MYSPLGWNRTPQTITCCLEGLPTSKQTLPGTYFNSILGLITCQLKSLISKFISLFYLKEPWQLQLVKSMNLKHMFLTNNIVTLIFIHMKLPTEAFKHTLKKNSSFHTGFKVWKNKRIVNHNLKRIIETNVKKI